MFGILRHKLVDTLRARQRTVNLSALESELDGEALLDRELFKDNGHWSSETKPRPRPTPETALRQQQFWTLFEMCLEHLPEHIGRVFMMREFLDTETEAICAELKMTANHCSVLIYRARLRLRTCLSEKGLSRRMRMGKCKNITRLLSDALDRPLKPANGWRSGCICRPAAAVAITASRSVCCV